MGRASLVLLLLAISWSWHVLGQQTTLRSTTRAGGSALRSTTRASQTTRTTAKSGQLVNIQRTIPRTTHVTSKNAPLKQTSTTKKMNQPTTKAGPLTTRTTARTTQGATKNAQLKQTSTTKRMNQLTNKSATLKAPFTTARTTTRTPTKSTTLARFVKTTTKWIPMTMPYGMTFNDFFCVLR
ncbi:uncharacterized protein LOC129732794 isoform X1 [Wyeomyia smithii]|uniref:uncharacterized protein LOC129732794 isoform X1 n=1 Tax=Wyeomyia smithii TaxID=174621 RepID=UPI002467DE8D|nr:uncharacterized protein LOC129732794 isoform X1 [Wyeomyia smithii]